MSDWKTIIGLEVHAEMLTETKMFSACPVVDSVTADPNSATDPLSLGMPGTLPVINRRAMEYGMMVGLALNCTIPPFNQFARKNYFYPDLPKGYQISQYDHPLAVDGYVDIELEDGTTKRIRVRRAHMEEDTGKLSHVGGGASLVDYNRSGVPLLEIVTEPDINSSAEAEAYARKLRAILQFLGVNHGDMSKGVLRFEANVSVMHKDDAQFRTRTEIKNLNSIRSMVRAIDAEVERQIALYKRGEMVKPATLGWDEDNGRIIIQRYKERPDEYRYFPEPDLPIVEVSRAWVERVRASLPELPDAKRARYVGLGLTPYDARILTMDRPVAEYYEAMLQTGLDAKTAANWVTGDLFRLMNEAKIDREAVNSLPLTAQAFAQLIQLVERGTINAATARKEVLPILWAEGGDPAQIVEARGLAQVSDPDLIGRVLDEVLAADDDAVRSYLSGKEQAANALFGQAMKQLKGKGDPAVVRQLLTEKLQAKRG
ncbi:MAG: Asp-tRNA(Asn)/Glu-tRNA(Gln) amidotransferase subunit GatB [Anaerolineae bacterium]|nr:Asp-tRNA(Asn)/Glu-tRNA(Gln) amidotransferase subunit GatB [Anaerolineae bacterium]MDW8173705.1 Asp-tRNA(Asn)/Glu-tRNA(Gln) amidotransferase subunit GatB [Anaerolineae bacterium]